MWNHLEKKRVKDSEISQNATEMASLYENNRSFNSETKKVFWFVLVNRACKSEHIKKKRSGMGRHPEETLSEHNLFELIHLNEIHPHYLKLIKNLINKNTSIKSI